MESLSYTLSKRRCAQKALALGIACSSTAFTQAELVVLKAPCIVRTDDRVMADNSYRKGRNWYIEKPSISTAD